VSKVNSQKDDPIFSHDTETLFAESKLNVPFCLGICFYVKVHFTL